MAENLFVNYPDTIKAGNDITTQGGEFRTLLERVGSLNEELKGVWKGPDADKYTKAISDQAIVMKKMNETIDELGAYAVKVGQAYQQQAEDNAGGIR